MLSLFHTSRACFYTFHFLWVTASYLAWTVEEDTMDYRKDRYILFILLHFFCFFFFFRSGFYWMSLWFDGDFTMGFDYVMSKKYCSGSSWNWQSHYCNHKPQSSFCKFLHHFKTHLTLMISIWLIRSVTPSWCEGVYDDWSHIKPRRPLLHVWWWWWIHYPGEGLYRVGLSSCHNRFVLFNPR